MCIYYKLTILCSGNWEYETNLTTANATSYYYLGGKLIASMEKAPGENGTLRYLHQDHLTSTSLMTDKNGYQIGSTVKYLPFGETRSGSVPTDKLFTGQRLDDVTGLYYYNARYYDPTLGRFISPDTIIPNPANPQCFNRYSYCLNNPLKYIDPSGHYFDWYSYAIAAAEAAKRAKENNQDASEFEAEAIEAATIAVETSGQVISSPGASASFEIIAIFVDNGFQTYHYDENGSQIKTEYEWNEKTLEKTGTYKWKAKLPYTSEGWSHKWCYTKSSDDRITWKSTKYKLVRAWNRLIHHEKWPEIGRKTGDALQVSWGLLGTEIFAGLAYMGILVPLTNSAAQASWGWMAEGLASLSDGKIQLDRLNGMYMP